MQRDGRRRQREDAAKEKDMSHHVTVSDFRSGLLISHIFSSFAQKFSIKFDIVNVTEYHSISIFIKNSQTPIRADGDHGLDVDSQTRYC